MHARSGGLIISRPRIERAVATARVLLLEAPGGYGKSTAWLSASRALDVPTVRAVLRSPQTLTGLISTIAVSTRRAGLLHVAEALDPVDPDGSLEAFIDRLSASGPVWLGVDEVHRVDTEGSAWLADLATELHLPNRMSLAGRRLPTQLRALPERTDAVLLTAVDLAFDPTETGTMLAAARDGLVPDPSEVDAIQRATGGWPAAVVLAVQTDFSDSTLSHAGPAVATGGVLRTLVERLIESGGVQLRDQLAAVSQLPLVSAEVAGLVAGEGALEALQDAGLPIIWRADGWAEIPDPVREQAGRATLSLDRARPVAKIYAARGELGEALDMLHRLGDREGVARLLAGQPRDTLARSGLAILHAIVAELPDSVLRDNPLALVQLIRAADKQTRLRRDWFARAELTVDADSTAGRAIAAERALDLARASDLDGALALAARVIADAADDEPTTLGRAHLCRALCLVIQDTAGSTAAAREGFETAASRFHVAAERDWEAEALQDLGYGVWFTSGALGAAAEALERALALRPAPDASRSESLTLLAEVLTHIGRLEDAAVAVREARGIAQRIGDDRALGYAAWSSADVAGAMRDRDAASAALDEAERHPGTWFDGLAGIDFLSDASEIRAVVGDRDGAWRDLERAESRAAGTAREGEPLSARVRLEAMYGDPEVGLGLIASLEESPFAYPNDRWLHALFRAACLARLGRAAEASEQVRRARTISSELGDPKRAARREPELLAIAEPGAEALDAATTVSVLGRFLVERGGRDVSPPAGRPATLVKLLAVRGQVTADEAIEELWPEIDEETGRARLRNLLNRVRAASGELVVRTEGALSLGPSVQVDATRFEINAASALAAPIATRAGLARAALARSTGELLPGDRYVDWATVPRERLRRRQLALIDIVSDDAIARGDFDEADRLLDEAITLDPLDELRYVRLARALMAQGRVRRAQRVAEQALSVAAEMATEPTDELANLLRELETQS